MIPPTPPDRLRNALRRLSAPHALVFGNRLLARATETLSFHEFVTVAREIVSETPEQASVYLATLVALDMADEDEPIRLRPPPSAN